MEIGPILRAMTRNKLGVVLIALQIAFTMTVVINAVFIINERSRLMARPSGIEESNMFFLRSTGFGDEFNEEVAVADDMALLRQTPGIVNASITNAVPLTNSGSGTAVRLSTDESVPAMFTAIYRVDEQIIDTMNLELVAGTNFSANDMRIISRNGNGQAEKTIISETFANDLFPELVTNEVVGKIIYMPGQEAVEIIGVVRKLQAPWTQNNAIERSMLVPINIIDGSSLYLIRTEPGELNRLMIETEEMLVANNDNRIIRSMMSLAEAREESYLIDDAMSKILWVVIFALIFITSMGIVGLAVFGINRRRKQIGTRRALGATRMQILRHFMTENFLITTVGVSLGAIMTIAFSIVLTMSFNMPTMAWYYTPVGMLMLILVGQLAVFGPSNGAARIEPAIATRSI